MMQKDEHNSYFFTLLQQDEVAATSEVRLDNGKNSHSPIISEEVQEPLSLATRKEELKNHEEKCKLLQGICSEGEGEVSHEHKEKYVAKMEEMTEILTDEDCARKDQGILSLDPTTGVVEEQSRGIRNTIDMIERVPTDGCSNFIETSMEGFPPLYVGDIDISLEEKVPISTSTSPLEFHEVDTR